MVETLAVVKDTEDVGPQIVQRSARVLTGATLHAAGAQAEAVRPGGLETVLFSIDGAEIEFRVRALGVPQERVVGGHNVAAGLAEGVPGDPVLEGQALVEIERVTDRPERDVDDDDRAARCEDPDALLDSLVTPGEVRLDVEVVGVTGVDLLEVVGGVEEDKVRRPVGHPGQQVEAVAGDDP